jgi:hypothetical protein
VSGNFYIALVPRALGGRYLIYGAKNVPFIIGRKGVLHTDHILIMKGIENLYAAFENWY